MEEVWPLHGLSLRTPRLELRPVRDEDIPGLVDAARAGIHDPGSTPFSSPWTDAPPEELPANTARFHWGLRAGISPERWHIAFAVLRAGRVIGSQDAVAESFGDLRTVGTGSWLTRAEQGMGLGREMRAAVLLWAFDHLGAEYATTAAVAGNAASIGVSLSLGYEPNGVRRTAARPGQPRDELHFRLRRDDFVRPEWELLVSGGDAARAQLLGPR